MRERNPLLREKSEIHIFMMLFLFSLFFIIFSISGISATDVHVTMGSPSYEPIYIKNNLPVSDKFNVTIYEDPPDVVDAWAIIGPGLKSFQTNNIKPGKNWSSTIRFQAGSCTSNTCEANVTVKAESVAQPNLYDIEKVKVFVKPSGNQSWFASAPGIRWKELAFIGVMGSIIFVGILSSKNQKFLSEKKK